MKTNNIQKIMLTALLLSVTCASQAMDTKKDTQEQNMIEKLKVTLPKASILTERLAKIGLAHFVEKTTIVQDLAGRTISVLSVLMFFEIAKVEYLDAMKNPMLNITMRLLQPLILKAILKDSPKALEAIEN